MRVPQSKFKKGSRAVILEALVDTQKEVLSIKKDMKKSIGESVDKDLAGRLCIIESLMRRVVAIQEVLIERGVLTREEIDRKRAEISPFWGE